jgi:hypothetical protein
MAIRPASIWQAEISERDLRATRRLATPASALLFSELDFLRHQHDAGS